MPRQQLLNLQLALAGGAREQRVLVLVGQMPAHELRGGERQRPIGEHGQDARKAPAGPRRFYAVEGSVFRQPQEAGAIREQRRVPGRQMQPPALQLGQMSDQLDRHFALTAREPTDLRQ
jgi:hypothetical protein